jgi:hypothetical protein
VPDDLSGNRLSGKPEDEETTRISPYHDFSEKMELLCSNEILPQSISSIPSTLSETSSEGLFHRYIVAEFVRLQSNPYLPGATWYSNLPAIVSMTPNPAVKYSILAAATIFYAVAHQTKRVFGNCYQQYHMGLKLQLSRLESMKRRHWSSFNPHPTAEDICAPVMFAFYELMACTTPRAWSHHVHAAAEMLEIRGPGNCRFGMEHEIFRSLRCCVVSCIESSGPPPIHAF